MKKTIFSLILLSLFISQACFGSVTIVNKTGKTIQVSLAYSADPSYGPIDFDSKTKTLQTGTKNGESQVFSPEKPFIVCVLVEGEGLIPPKVRLASGEEKRDLEDGATYVVTLGKEDVVYLGKDAAGKFGPQSGMKPVCVFTKQ